MEVLPILFALCNLVGVMSRACGYDAMKIPFSCLVLIFKVAAIYIFGICCHLVNEEALVLVM